MLSEQEIAAIGENPQANESTEHSNASFITSYDVMASFAKDDEDDYLEIPDNIGSSIEDEIRIYLEKSTAPIKVDVLQWWADNSQQMPILSKAARLVLSIPASSAAAERNFSTAGGIITDKRSALLPKNVNNILMCHGNPDLKEKVTH